MVEIEEALDLAGFGKLKEFRFEASAGPDRLFLFAVHAAREVEAPGGCVGGKVETLERDGDFGDPTLGGA